MKKKISYYISVLIFINICILFIIVLVLPNQLKIDIRWALFSNVTDKQVFQLPPEKMDDFKWSKDKFRKQFLYNNHLPFDTIKSDSVRHSIEKIVLKFSKNGGIGCGEKSNNLIENINWVQEGSGHGCCSDHSQVFLSLSLLNDIPSREVHHKSHTFNEYWDKELDKWIWVDSQFCLMAQNENGEYLGLLDIHTAFKNQKKVNWYFFGTSRHQLYQKNPYEDKNKYFTSEPFGALIMTMGNNIFEQDYYNKKTYFLPKDLRQLILYSIGIYPKFSIYDPDQKIIPYYKKVRDCIYIAIILYSTCLAYFTFSIFFKKSQPKS